LDDAGPSRAARYLTVIPFAPNTSLAFGDARKTMKLSAVSGCGARLIVAAVNVI
jgi:hypothetical protein